MDFTLSREQLMAQQLFRDFAQNEVKPLAAEVDEEEKFPEENVKKMAKLGFFGIPVPKQYGGQGADVLTYAMCVEEMSKVCGTTGVIISAHTSLCSDHWVLNGSKIFITNAGYADVFIVIAVTGTVKDKKGRSMKEISAFIVERGFPGFSIGKHEKKMGIRGSSTCELVFEDCIVPKENLLGVQGRGFIIAMATLDGGRIGIAAQALGIAEGAIEETIKYTKERVQFGKRISQQQNTQFQLADMAASTQGAQYLVYAAACKKQAANENPNIRYSVEAAMAKLVAAEVASDVTRRCLQLFGGYGYTRDYPIERMMRDAKITEIYEGTSEVQRMVIAGNLGVN